jgi:methionine-rich copper-binding protein CopC
MGIAAVAIAALSQIGFMPSALANSLVSTSPAVGSVLSVAPNAVSVSAAVTLLTDGNSISVTDPTGKQVDDGSLTVSDTTAVIGVKPLNASGIYTVNYTLLSETEAPLTGSFTFLFNGPPSISSPSASAAPTPIQTLTSKPAASNSSANLFVLILIVAAVLVGLFLIWYARLIWKDSKKSRKPKTAPTRVAKRSSK